MIGFSVAFRQNVIFESKSFPKKYPTRYQNRRWFVIHFSIYLNKSIHYEFITINHKMVKLV